MIIGKTFLRNDEKNNRQNSTAYAARRRPGIGAGKYKKVQGARKRPGQWLFSPTTRRAMRRSGIGHEDEQAQKYKDVNDNKEMIELLLHTSLFITVHNRKGNDAIAEIISGLFHSNKITSHAGRKGHPGLRYFYMKKGRNLKHQRPSFI